MMQPRKLWGNGAKLDKVVEAFTVGNDPIIDARLVKYDCMASIAHARMLGKMGVLSKVESGRLVSELKCIMALAGSGKFMIAVGQEDVHTAIENALTARLGALGKKIHTGRSRNDQVLTALRLYYKDGLTTCIKLARKSMSSMEAFSAKYGDVELPGYTHMRKAMPSSIALWAGAHIDSMKDNIKLLESAVELVDQSPLGTGAGYGVPIGLDRKMTANELGFARVQWNPVYAQLSRGKFEATILHALSQVMLDINRIATDLVLFSMPEFGYFVLPASFTTGSSMMPNKRNPDVLELLRAKYHVVVAHEMEVKSIAANLPSGYNRDMQLTKWPVMDGFDITEQCLDVVSLVFGSISVSRKNCKKGLTGDIYATQRAYEMVASGTPFRDAHAEVSKGYK